MRMGQTQYTRFRFLEQMSRWMGGILLEKIKKFQRKLTTPGRLEICLTTHSNKIEDETSFNSSL